MLQQVSGALAQTDFSPQALDAALRRFAESTGRKLGQVAQPLRAALTGSTSSPGIDETLAALGRDEALARIAARRRLMNYGHKHLLAIEGLHPPEIAYLLDLAESYVLLNRSGKTQRDLLRGRTLINLFFEDSTRTRTSFELAGKRLGADVINMSVADQQREQGRDAARHRDAR